MDDLFKRFLSSIGIVDPTPYNNCSFRVTKNDKENQICYVEITKDYLFKYEDAKRLLDGVNNAKFRNSVTFKYTKNVSAQDVYNLLLAEFLATPNTDESQLPKCTFLKNEIKFIFSSALQFNSFKHVLEVWEELLADLNINYDITTDIVYKEDLEKKKSQEEALKKIATSYQVKASSFNPNDAYATKRVKGNYVPGKIADFDENSGNVEIEAIVFKADETITRKGKQIVTLDRKSVV